MGRMIFATSAVDVDGIEHQILAENNGKEIPTAMNLFHIASEEVTSVRLARVACRFR